MEFRILGPLEVSDGGRTIEIPAPKQRLLLTVLALAAGAEVSADRLLQELWGDDPPGGGLKTLQYHVSKLRDALQPGRESGEDSVIVTRPHGYALAVLPDEVDAVRFGRIVRDARRLLEFDPSQAALLLREGLDLWRGPLPTALLETPVASLEARRLTELRLTALEDRIDADVATGRHAEVVPELEALVTEHPLRERLWALLIVALYRSDRQAEALRAYQRLSTILGEELGIEPSPDLRRLEEMVLLQVPDLDVPEGLRRPASLRGYELQDSIGEGAFGMVWRASQRSVDREVAIKVVRPEFANRPGFVLGFQAEAQRLAMLEHPHIVPVFDFWRDPDGAYLVMQLMAAGSLAAMQGTDLDTSAAVEIIEQVGSALAYAHRRGVAHGDLHPGNILFDGEGNSYLADFGLAAFLSGGSSTPPEAFASPEQLRGEPPDPATDVYAFGRIAYRLLAGADPGTGPLPRIAATKDGVPGAVDGVLRRATDPDPAHRYEDAAGFLADLRASLGEAPIPFVEVRNPYKGLQAFGEADAADYFGRDGDVAELLDALARQRLVAVVGPSGCGKSSLVRAGLVPEIRNGRLAGAKSWVVAEAYPGSDPFAALTEAVRSVAVEAVPPPPDKRWDPDRIAPLVRRVLPPGTGLVLVVDQFEELFTLCPTEIERTRFMDSLLALATAPDESVRIVLTLRADYYGLPLDYRPFGDVLRGAVVSLTPPGPEQLLEAITGPAAAAGLSVGADLAADIVADAAAEPGGLPLMEYALTRLAAEQSDGRLTLAAYREMGGLAEALGTWPEGLYQTLDETARAACRQIFLRLVSVEESGEDTRRRVPVPELHALGIAPVIVDGVVEQFAGARLVTYDNDPETRVPTIEVAHEALLARWRRLGGWVDEQREALLLHRRYRNALAEWEQADRSPEYQLAGGRLRQFESWRDSSDLALTPDEIEFLQASREQEDAAAAARQNRRRLVGASLGLLALVALVFGIVALIQRNDATDQRTAAEEQAAIARTEATRAEQEASRAEEQTGIALAAQSDAEEQAAIAATERANAEAQERIARARSLAGAAMANLEIDAELAVLLAIEAVNTTREADGTVLRQAEEALHAAVNADRLVSTAMVEQWARSVAYDPDGSRYYVAGRMSGDIVAFPDSAIVGDLDVPALPDEPSSIAGLAIAGNDDELLVVSHYNSNLIHVLDRNTLEERYALETEWGWVTDLDVSDDGTTLATVNRDSATVTIWDLADETVAREFECPGGCGTVALAGDAGLVASGGTVWDVSTGEALLTELAEGVIGDQEFLDEDRLVFADGMVARVVDVATGDTMMTLERHGANIRNIGVSPDGRLIATGAEDGLAVVWDVAGVESSLVLELPGHTGTVWETRFSPDGRYLTTIGGRQELPSDLVNTWPRDWEARTWDVSSLGVGEVLITASQERHAAFLPDGDAIVVAGADQGAAIWDIAAESAVVSFGGHAAASAVTAVAVSPDGTMVALGGNMIAGDAGEAEAGWVAVFDPATGAMLTELEPPTAGLEPKDLAFSFSGDHLALAGFGRARVWDTASWQVLLAPSEFARFIDETTWEVISAPAGPADDALFTAVAFLEEDLVMLQYFPFDQVYGYPSMSVWDLASGQVTTDFAHIPRDDFGTLAVSPDGHLVVTAGIARPELLEPWTGRTLTRIGGGSAYAVTAAFSPDGALVATGEADGTVRLWNASTAEEQLVLTGHTGAVTDVAFGPDGTRLVSVSRDGTMRVWALDLDELLDLAASRIDRELTDAECRAYIGVDCPPAEAAERLIPATADWEGLYGIDPADLAASPAGGTWAEGDAGRDGATVLDSDTGRVFFLGSYGAPSSVLDLASGEWSDVSSMPPISEDDPWTGSVGPSVYVPSTGMIVAIRQDDGVTMGYEVESDSWSELVASIDAFVGRMSEGPVYDPTSDTVVLFGGAQWGRTDEGFHVGLADTWVFDPMTAEWTEVSPAVSPPPRVRNVMVYDAASDRIVVFGGSDHNISGETLDDTWTYNTETNTWTAMQPAVSPSPRANAYAWYDPVADRTFVFGGSADWSGWPPLPWMVLGGEGLWAYDLDADAWSLYRTNPNPGYRLEGTAVFDVAAGEAVIFGGDTYDADRRFTGWAVDTWIYRHGGG
jgi:WD40 repeat protein/DNA-binding SARP family transcriptional activator